MATLEELKQEATELGITFSANIGAEKLTAKIEDFYKSQETSEKEILEAMAKKEAEAKEEKSEEKSAVSGNKELTKKAKIKAAEDRAKETRVITIIDNDQRVNNQTTVATVNCSNAHFDLGTVHIPLNVPVEVRQGHIDVLKGVEIPQHVKDPQTGLHKVYVRPRYSISFEQMD